MKAIDHIGESKYTAKQAQGWKPGRPVKGIHSFETLNTVFDRAITYTNWLAVEYPEVRLYEHVDHEMTAEFLSEKAEACQANTVQTLVSTLRKLQEGLYAMNWIKSDIVPADWQTDGDDHQPRGPYAPDEAAAIWKQVDGRDPELGQALRFILSSGARIDEVLHLRADKVFVDEKRVELLDEGGKPRNGRGLDSSVLRVLNLALAFVSLRLHGARLCQVRLQRHVVVAGE